MVEWLEQNQFLSSGLTLMLVGASMALLRRLPLEVWAYLVHRLTISVEVPDRDPAFRWLQSWVAGQRYTRAGAEPEPDDDLGEYRAGPGQRQRSRGQLPLRAGLRGAVPPVAGPGHARDEVSGAAAGPPEGPAGPGDRRHAGVPGDADPADPGGRPGADRRPAAGGPPHGATPEPGGQYLRGRSLQRLVRDLVSPPAPAGLDHPGRRSARGSPGGPARSSGQGRGTRRGASLTVAGTCSTGPRATGRRRWWSRRPASCGSPSPCSA